MQWANELIPNANKRAQDTGYSECTRSIAKRLRYRID